jgi:hypothetical protein
MKAPRRKIPFFILIVFILLLSAASSPNPQARWVIGTVDAPMLFEGQTNSVLKVIDGIPYTVFGGDHLYYAYFDADLADWEISTVDDNPGVGSSASLAIAPSGSRYISYYDSFNRTLKFATPRIFPIGWYVETIDATPGSGVGSAIAAPVSGQPHISYLSGSDLKYIKGTCTIAFPHPILSCTWSTPEVVAAGVSGNYPSIAIASDGTPHISYMDGSENLMHAYKIGAGGNCGVGGNWQCDLVQSLPGSVWYSPSIALWNDWPRIAFFNPSNGLSFAYKDGTGWHVSAVNGVNNELGAYPSLAMDANGIPNISSRSRTDSDSKRGYYAYGSSASGGTWTNEFVPYSSWAGQTAIAFNQSPTAYPCILFSMVHIPEYQYGYLSFTCKSPSWTMPDLIALSYRVGRFSSLALDTNGVPFIAYQDRLDQFGVPKVATWSDTPEGCSGSSGTGQWECEIVNDLHTNHGGGTTISVAINPVTGTPAVSYLDQTGVDALGYAWYVGSGGNCTGNPAWNCTKIDMDGTYWPGYESKLAFDASGTPVIAYITGAFDADNPRLKLARYVGPGLGDCNTDSNWTCEVVDSSLGSYGGQPSLALTSNGKAVISYNHNTDQQLKVALEGTSGGTGCNSSTTPGKWSCFAVDPSIGTGLANSSLALNTDMSAYISYSNPKFDILYYAWVNLDTKVGYPQVVDENRDGFYNSIVYYQGGPWIAYSSYTGNYSLHLAHFAPDFNGNCGYPSIFLCETIDADGSVGKYPSLKINNAGMAYISYYDDSNGDLKLAYTRLFSFLPLLQKP